MSKTIKINPPTDEQVEEWANMTDNNLHSEVMVEVAKWYKAECRRAKIRVEDDFVAIFTMILKSHMKAGHLTTLLCNIRNSAFKAIRESIEENVGIVVLQKVEEGL